MRGHFVGINVLERPPCVAMASGLKVFDIKGVTRSFFPALATLGRVCDVARQ